MKTHINRQAVKRYAKDVAQERHHKFTRVAEGFFAKCEGQLRRFIREQIHRLPSAGKTIQLLALALVVTGCTKSGPDMGPVGAGLSVIGLGIVIASVVRALLRPRGGRDE
jgi:hypothetical protein